VDGSGVVRFSNDLDHIPLAYRNAAEKIIETDMPQENDSGKKDYIPFERISGVMVVDVIFNGGVKAKMVFDTGASLVVISEILSKRLNQDLSTDNQKVKLRTAGGNVDGRSIVIQRMALGGMVKQNVIAAVNGGKEAYAGFDGLLGLSFLEGFEFTIDYINSRIVISNL
jgi:clan AA aspartic protease (TIGR02281 family)